MAIEKRQLSEGLELQKGEDGYWLSFDNNGKAALININDLVNGRRMVADCILGWAESTLKNHPQIQPVPPEEKLAIELERVRLRARKTLRTTFWRQEFNGNELEAVNAMLASTWKTRHGKEKALNRAIEFIGLFEADEQHGPKALEALEDINQLLFGQSLTERFGKKP